MWSKEGGWGRRKVSEVEGRWVDRTVGGSNERSVLDIVEHGSDMYEGRGRDAEVEEGGGCSRRGVSMIEEEGG